VLLETERPLSPAAQLALTEVTAELARHLNGRRLLGRGKPGLGDPARLLLAGQRVWLHGRPLYLSQREYIALQSLYLTWGRPCPRDKLREIVYPGEAPTLLRRENRLELLLARLRKKVAVASQGQVTIEAQRGQGYRLVLTVV
jgi:DNA-binding response OmpR family regulator